jgi:hypothetical protein
MLQRRISTMRADWGGVPAAVRLKRDGSCSGRHPALGHCWSMMFSENRYPLFGIMLYQRHMPRMRAAMSTLTSARARGLAAGAMAATGQARCSNNGTSEAGTNRVRAA